MEPDFEPVGLYHINEWSIPSNDHYNEIRFEAQFYDESTESIEFLIELSERGSGREEPGDQHENHDIEISRSQLFAVPMLRADCVALVADFDSWIKSRTAFIRHLHLQYDRQRLTIDLGDWSSPPESVDGQRTSEHPVLTFSYHAGIFLEMRYVTDESGIRIARNGLTRVLNHFGA